MLREKCYVLFEIKRAYVTHAFKLNKLYVLHAELKVSFEEQGAISKSQALSMM